MSIQVTCDGCGKTGGPIWGTFDYSPGGGRHGVERFHFCMDCTRPVRAFVASRLFHAPEMKSKGAVMSGRWMFFEDVRKDARETLDAA